MMFAYFMIFIGFLTWLYILLDSVISNSLIFIRLSIVSIFVILLFFSIFLYEWKHRNLVFFILFLICFNLFIFLPLDEVYNEVIMPSYYSVSYDCKPVEIKPKYEKKLNDVGIVRLGSFNTQTKEITLLYDDPKGITNRHELMHMRQLSEDRLFGCNQKVLRYFNELEANLAGYYGWPTP